jgi:hypothetical protein
MPEPTHYEILGVAANAPDHVIKSAYRAHAKHNHPDTGASADVDFAAISLAYTILSDPDQRAEYDRTLGASSDSSGQSTESSVDPDSYEDKWGKEDRWSPEYEYEESDFASEDPRKLAGYDAWRAMPITPAQITWMPDAQWSQMNYVPLDRPVNQPQPQPDSGVSDGKHGAKCTVWSIVWFVAAIAYGVFANRAHVGIFGFGAFIGAAIFGLPYVFGGRKSALKWLTLGYYLFAVFAFLIGVVMASASPVVGAGDTSPTSRVVALAIVTVVLCVAFGFAAREGNLVFTDRSLRTSNKSAAPMNSQYSGHLIPPDQVERVKQWGTPGRGLNDVKATPFSERNAELGFGGEILTSQLMDPMEAIPGVRIVHGINLPGHGEADIDHVILCGDLLVAVDSKHWPGGNYYWLSEQIMCTTQNGTERRGNPMSWGLPTLQQSFPNKRVLPVVVIHSYDGAPVATNNRDRGSKPVLMSPNQFVEEIGRTCVDVRATTVDPVALTKLVSMMAK